MKPHLLALLAPLWLGYHLLRWRRGERRSALFLAGAGAASLLLGGASFVLLPSWLGDFVRAARAYVAVGPGASAALVVAQLALPAPLTRPAAALLTVAALAWVAGDWRDAVAEPSGQSLARREWRQAGDRGMTRGKMTEGSGELRAIWRTLVATALVVPPAWETNAVLLLLPLAAALAHLPSPRAAAFFTAASAALTLALLPPYFVLGWQRGTVVIAAYVTLLAGARLSRQRAPWFFGGAPGARAARALSAAGDDPIRAGQSTANAHTGS